MTMIRFIHTVPAFTSNLCLSQTLCDAGRLFTDVKDPYSLWGAYAIPLALSIIRHVVHRTEISNLYLVQIFIMFLDCASYM